MRTIIKYVEIGLFRELRVSRIVDEKLVFGQEQPFSAFSREDLSLFRFSIGKSVLPGQDVERQFDAWANFYKAYASQFNPATVPNNGVIANPTFACKMLIGYPTHNIRNYWVTDFDFVNI
ncbi:MAG: hypothetical protein M1587_07255 [Thaumarchaeota archaeon]|nr:hypothetical protein [Nitrososphaerota archaeon]